MRLKLKYALPLVQMALAVGLLRWSHLWYRSQAKISDMPGPAPAFTLLMSINASLALVRGFIYRYLPGYWDGAILIVVIGLFWYWIALDILRWRERRSVVMFAWHSLRIRISPMAEGCSRYVLFYVLVSCTDFLLRPRPHSLLFPTNTSNSEYSTRLKSGGTRFDANSEVSPVILQLPQCQIAGCPTRRFFVWGLLKMRHSQSSAGSIDSDSNAIFLSLENKPHTQVRRVGTH
jgi:hypothetical protein